MSVVLNGNEYTLNKEEQDKIEKIILKMQNNKDDSEIF